MSFEIKKASRNQVKLKIGFWGPSGSGKTMSALRFAKGLVGDYSKVCVIDTENGSAGLYSHLGDFDCLDLGAPFSPQRYVEAIKFIENQNKYDCIIIDSITHEWSGKGGCLEIHSNLGGQFHHWAKVTPMHNSFVDAILQSNCHVLVTGRSKTDYAMAKDNNNRTKVDKMGLKTDMRDNFEYELTVTFQISHENHLAIVDKDRTNIWKGSNVPFQIDEEVGQTVAAWNGTGINPRINKMVDAFENLGVDKFALENHYACPVEELNDEQLEDAGNLFRDIRDGVTSVEDVFEQYVSDRVEIDGPLGNTVSTDISQI